MLAICVSEKEGARKGTYSITRNRLKVRQLARKYNKTGTKSGTAADDIE